jgi:hypothetical protein
LGHNPPQAKAEEHGIRGTRGLVDEAVQQRDAADEGQLEPCGSIIIGQVIVNQGEVVRPSQLIASVRRA